MCGALLAKLFREATRANRAIVLDVWRLVGEVESESENSSEGEDPPKAVAPRISGDEDPGGEQRKGDGVGKSTPSGPLEP